MPHGRRRPPTESRPRVVVVAGASGGVGRACARAFAAQGATVAVLARGSRGLGAAVAEIEQRGGRAQSYVVDVADADAVDAIAVRIEAELGEIDVWVNAAFTSVFARFVDIGAEEYRRVTEVTYLGVVNGTRSALRRMLPRDRGTIVQVGSALSYRGIPLQSAYSGAKHAVQGFNEALRCELLHDGSGVRTTMVQLPGLNTPQFSWVLSRLPRQPQPVPPVYQPEIAARAVVFATDHPSRREHWVAGSTVATLLANAVVPGLLDRYLARTAYSSQQTSEARRDDRPANLWQPADAAGGEDFGAKGDFDDRAHVRAPQLWASQHRDALAVAGGVAAAIALWGGLRSRS